MVTAVELDELEGALKSDAEFKAAFDEDPVGAVRSRGMSGIAEEFEQLLADPERLRAELPEVAAHGLTDKLATRPRLLMLLVSSAAVASMLGAIRGNF